MAKQKKSSDKDPAHEVKVLQKDEKRRFTLGVVYEPNTLDTDNEFTDAAELEKACHDYMRHLQGNIAATKSALEIVDGLTKAAEGKEDEIKIDITGLRDEIAKRGVKGMHAIDLPDCEVVECYIAPVDFELNGETVKKGSWLAGIVWSPEVFKKIESGEWTGYSMGGRAMKQKVEDDE